MDWDFKPWRGFKGELIISQSSCIWLKLICWDLKRYVLPCLQNMILTHFPVVFCLFSIREMWCSMSTLVSLWPPRGSWINPTLPNSHLNFWVGFSLMVQLAWRFFAMVLQGLRNAWLHGPCNEISASPAFCNIWDISPLLLGWFWNFKSWICWSVSTWEHTEVCSPYYWVGFNAILFLSGCL